MFTGDRSGDFLYASLHRTGFAAHPHSLHRDDGQRLIDCWITAAVRCAPPQNRPTPAERDRCRPYLERELALLPARVLVALGGFAWQVLVRMLGPAHPKPTSPGRRLPEPFAAERSSVTKFGHGATTQLGDRTMLGSYHPSQQNTFTGRLTPDMLDDVFLRARQIADG
jgi:uracil-DNA glycosylase